MFWCSLAHFLCVRCTLGSQRFLVPCLVPPIEREREREIEKATGKVTAMSGSMSNGYEGYDHTLVECLPSPLGAASGQGETLAARRFELSEELVRINTHSWVP